MEHIIGKDHFQAFSFTFEEQISSDNPVRVIEQHPKALKVEAIRRNNQRVIEQKEIYRRRQAIIEHPFGTIKRARGYTFTLLKGLEKVNGAMGLIFTVYNLRRGCVHTFRTGVGKAKEKPVSLISTRL